MAQDVARCRAGRFIAALFTAAVWLGLIYGVALLVMALVNGTGGAALAQGLALITWPLVGVLPGQIGRAVFDMAERGSGQAGG